MSMFGWSYPAGAANDPNAPYNQEDPPCEVCGLDVHFGCMCDPCPVCEENGNPACYIHHGLSGPLVSKLPIRVIAEQMLYTLFFHAPRATPEDYFDGEAHERMVQKMIANIWEHEKAIKEK